jgi:hypothetical protein
MITAILNVYRRPELLAKQVELLKKQSRRPDHIWVWQNKAPEKIDIRTPKRCVHVQSNFNFLYHGRFALALLAQRHSEYVAIFDDDIMPGSRWLENCLTSMEEKPGLYVATGNRLLPNEFEGQKRPWFGWRGPSDVIEEVDYGGHCWFLKSDWLRFFWGETPISLENAEDIQLSFALQKNAGIHTYTPPHPEGYPDLWSNTVGWKYGKSKVASHKKPPTGITKRDWFRQRRQIEQECIKRGWKPMYMRGGIFGD